MQYRWNQEKDAELIARHGVGFDDIQETIASGGLLDTISHYNPDKYPSQWIYIIHMRGYIYTVPFVYESQGVVFLKTIIPQRKFKKQYLSS